jgi:holin-like protein
MLTRKIIEYIYGITSLIVCYFIGFFISSIVSNIITPSIAGMLILFISLRLKIINQEYIRSTIDFFLENLMLFFIPATVGVATISFSSFKSDLLSIVLAATISTVVVLWVTGYISQKFEKIDTSKNVN